MQPYRFKRIYHPKLGKFVYQHKGSGLIVDNIFKPISGKLLTVSKAVLKPLAKKTLVIMLVNMLVNMLLKNQVI